MMYLKRISGLLFMLVFTSALAEPQEYDFTEEARLVIWTGAISDERTIYSSVASLDAEKLIKEDWPESLTTLVQSELWSSTLAAASDLSAQVTQTVRVLSPTDVADTYWTELKQLNNDMSGISYKILFLPSELETILYEFESAELYSDDPDEYDAELEKAEAKVDVLEAGLTAMGDQIDAVDSQLAELTPTD